MEEEEFVKAKILRTLVRKGKWLHAHTPLTNIIKWLVIRRNGKRVKKLINELKKDNLIIFKPTHYGEEISLNPYQKDKIMEIIKKYFGEE